MTEKPPSAPRSTRVGSGGTIVNPDPNDAAGVNSRYPATGVWVGVRNRPTTVHELIATLTPQAAGGGVCGVCIAVSRSFRAATAAFAAAADRCAASALVTACVNPA